MIAGWPWWLWAVTLAVGSAIPTGAVVWAVLVRRRADPERPDGPGLPPGACAR